jgi:SAM-dependent methyltransferase
MDHVLIRKTCLACGGVPLKSVLHLGQQSLTGFPRRASQARRGPLEVMLCTRCKLMQMRHTYPPAWLYTWYGYRSGINPLMVEALQSVKRSICSRMNLHNGDTVVDIGSNDGTFLRMLPSGIRRVGFEPAKNLRADAKVGLDLLVPQYFASGHLEKWQREHGPAKVVTALAMFYDLDQPVEFLRQVRAVLRNDGLLVLQQNYLPDILLDMAFDNFSHEHVALYSLATLTPVLAAAGFRIWDVEHNAVNGGSFRVYARPEYYCSATLAERAWAVDGLHRIDQMMKHEKHDGISRLDTYRIWSHKVLAARQAIIDGIRHRAKAGKRIYVCGASTRGLVILEYCNLGKDVILGASERNPEKWGRFYGATGIRCISEDEARAKADCLFVLPWHFLSEIKKRENMFLANGGELLVPLPRFLAMKKGR